jgi:uncharacterized protein YbjT (DUF2867 family)
MGGTDNNHMLNRLGKGANILRYKRKAEMYLIESGLDYTIINPGGLQNEDAGVRELEVSHNDELIKLYEVTAIPRGDVAAVAVEAVLCKNSSNKALDIIAKPRGVGTVTYDFEALFAQTGSEL